LLDSDILLLYIKSGKEWNPKSSQPSLDPTWLTLYPLFKNSSLKDTWISNLSRLSPSPKTKITGLLISKIYSFFSEMSLNLYSSIGEL